MPPKSTKFILALSIFQSLSLTSAWSWSASHNSKSATTPKVSGHTAASTTQKDGTNGSIVLFGGLTGSAGSPATDELWMLQRSANFRKEDDDEKWALQPKKEEETLAPQRRMYAASAILNGSYYLFGGWDPGAPGSGGTFLDDIWRLSLDDMKWSKLDTTFPYPVSRHSACTIGDSIILHTFKGIFRFSAKEEKIYEQPTSGEGPEGLSMCASASLNDNCMVIFGGSSKALTLSDGAFVLDTDSWSWQKLKKRNGVGPSTRSSACAAPCSGTNKCIVFGGADLGGEGYASGLIAQDDTWLLTVDEGWAEWEKIASHSLQSPEGRVAASLNCLGENDFILQGGWDPASKDTFDQTWILKR